MAKLQDQPRIKCFSFKTIKSIRTIDLVSVFDAILTSRQTCEKLQCLYENLMSSNFLRTAVLKKNINCKLKVQIPVLKFLQRLALDFPYVCL